MYDVPTTIRGYELLDQEQIGELAALLVESPNGEILSVWLYGFWFPGAEKQTRRLFASMRVGTEWQMYRWNSGEHRWLRDHNTKWQV